VLNKIDRLSGNEVQKSKLHTEEIFFWQKVMTTSAKNNIGIDELRKDLMACLK
jgi:50S ribosomal subunit-associated GTPase HflX